MSSETLHFEAEVSRLLDIVANALYSDKQIFLRELISNASDACDKLRYDALTNPDLLADGSGELRLSLIPDMDAKTLTLKDNGIGMSREDLINNLGTIAKSGTAAFMAQMAEQKKEEEAGKQPSLIGQFGVGFYSAFMVADKVTVTTRHAGDDAGWIWESDGKSGYTINPVETADRGAEITLYLKEDQQEFLETARLEQIVKRYSDHISLPIDLIEKDQDPRTLNAASALWTRPKSEITEEQYTEFYHHVSHGFDIPFDHLHFRVEGMMEYTGLLYIPTSRPYDLFHPDRKSAVKLYVRKVFITDDCQELIPSYLRFLRGVVDTEDLPLNVSRELLQNDRRLTKIRSGVTKKVLDYLTKKAKDDPKEYIAFFDTFGAVLKEGLYEDQAQRETLLSLSRFKSVSQEGWTSFADYKDAMPEGQEAIYYIIAADEDTARRSPQVEGFTAKGVNVLIMTDAVDDFWVSSVANVLDLPLKSVTRGGADLDKVAKKEDDNAPEAEKVENTTAIDSLLAMMKQTLEGQVKDVRRSDRLTQSPVCLVADEGDMDMQMERLLRAHQQVENGAKRILEINPTHDAVQKIAESWRSAQDDSQKDIVKDAVWTLLDQALIMEGEPVSNPTDFVQRLSKLMARGLS